MKKTFSRVLWALFVTAAIIPSLTFAAPIISELSPEDDAVNAMKLPASYSITFDQNVIAGTGAVTIRRADNNSVVETFDITDIDHAQFDGTYLAFIPTVKLDPETAYYIFIDAGAIKDESEDPFGGIADPTTWNFTTTPAGTVILDDTFVTGAGFDQPVNTLISDSNEDSIVGGEFTTYDGDPVARIARLNTDGSLDNTFVTGDGFDASVSALAIDADGKIIVGGNFTTYDGDAVTRIARLNTDGSLDNTFVTGDGFDSLVRSVAIDADGKIIVGGDFTVYDGDAIGRGIARLNTDGSLDNTFVTGSGFDASAFALAVDADGKILVGGNFTTYDGDAIGWAVVRLNTDGSLDNTFVTGSGFDASAFALAVDADGKILVGGNFTTYDGDAIGRGITRLNTDGSLDNTFVTGDGFSSGSITRAIAFDAEGNILAVGDFSSYDGNRAMNIVRLKNDGLFDDAFTAGDGFDNSNLGIVVDSSGKIVVGGYWTMYDGDGANHIARLMLSPDEEPVVEEELTVERNTLGRIRTKTPSGFIDTTTLLIQLQTRLIELLKQLLAELAR